jgi:predicted HicB family RNase H-like nuclease
MFFLACSFPHETGQNDVSHSARDQNLASEISTEDINSFTKTMKNVEPIGLKRAWFNDSNWIDFRIEHSYAKIEDYVVRFKKSATLDVYFKGRIKDKREFIEFCESNSEPPEKNTLSGDIDFYVNPLNAEIARRLANKVQLSVVEIINPFVIKDIKFEIFAAFLSDEEKEWISNVEGFQARTIMDEVNINIFSLSVDREDHGKVALIRFLCGLAKKEAELRYELSDATGKTIYVDINDVNFEAQLY